MLRHFSVSFGRVLTVLGLVAVFGSVADAALVSYRFTSAGEGGEDPALSPTGAGVIGSVGDTWMTEVGTNDGSIMPDNTTALLDVTNLVGPVGLPLDSNGSLNLTLAIPNDPTAPGKKVYLQLFAADANGATASNALELLFCR